MTKFKFQPQDSIVVIESPYRGWVGYAQDHEKDGYLKVRLFDGNGNIASVDELPVEDIKNIEPEPRFSQWDY